MAKDETILDEALEEETTESMSEEELRGIISSEIQKALKSMDFSKATKCTTITSGTLDEKISRSVKDAVNDAVKKQMEDYRKDVESSTLPPPPTQMMPVSSMIPVQEKPGLKPWQKVGLGLLSAVAIGLGAFAIGRSSGDQSNIFDGDMPD